MTPLRKLTLGYNERKDDWYLSNDKTDRIIKRFEDKGGATSRNTLRNVLGNQGGSVKIQKMNGRIQEERTYPKGRDPKSSKG